MPAAQLSRDRRPRPDKDATYRIIPPTEYVSSLARRQHRRVLRRRTGGQRAVYEGAGFIHAISRDLWNGHPCCSVTAPESWISSTPNTFMAYYRWPSSPRALHVSDKNNRAGMRKCCRSRNTSKRAEIVVEQVITGRYRRWGSQHQDRGGPRRLPAVPAYSAAVC